MLFFHVTENIYSVLYIMIRRNQFRTKIYKNYNTMQQRIHHLFTKT